MYAADTLDAELTSHNISDSGYPEMDTCSYERMDLFRSREYKEYRATPSAAEGLDFIWGDDDSITSYYAGDDASVSPAFQLPSRLLLRDFAHTDGPALTGWPEDLSGMDEELLREEESDYEATWEHWGSADYEACSVYEDGGVEIDRGRTLERQWT
nr:hypothetical protein B0A51_10937 [Rachicladosporium sp. CCFEE 5018]